MTCIVGMLDKSTNTVIIGGDSASVNTDGFNLYLRKDTKIFKNSEFAIGCTSSFRMIQLLRYSFKPPEIGEREIYEYMCTSFIDGVRDCFIKGGFMQHNSKGDEIGGSFLVAYKNRLFKVEDDFQVGETIYGFDACGCGQDIAFGAMFALMNIPTIATMLKLNIALEAAETFSAGVRRPFEFIST